MAVKRCTRTGFVIQGAAYVIAVSIIRSRLSACSFISDDMVLVRCPYHSGLALLFLQRD
jgi:hypothetical protein